MRPSEFGDLVFGAISLMEDGRYADSVDSFREIIRLNSNFSLAYRGIGLAAYYSDNYEEAMRMFELAGDKVGFSDAFWQIRLEFFQRHFAMLANILVALGVIAIIGGRLKKKYNISFKIRLFKREYLLIEQLKHALFILRRPIEGFTDIRYESKGSYLSACILVLAAIIVLLFKTFYTHFPFTGNQPVHELKVGVIILQFVVVWLSWVICNYLISSIYQGEGRFKDVFVGSTYAFTPLILFGIPVVIMSNGMSLSEVSIYNFFDLFIILWILALVFWKVQALQNYSVGETIINILLTMFAMIILWVLIFIVLGLSSEFFEFLYSLYQEVTMR
jgi:tetratricopeptide (TPR) repeat protein